MITFCSIGPCVELKSGRSLCNVLPDCGCAGEGFMRGIYAKALTLVEAQDWDGLRKEFRLDDEPRLYYAVLMILDQFNLIEHGTSIRCSWLTEEGKEFLAAARKHWPELQP